MDDSGIWNYNSFTVEKAKAGEGAPLTLADVFLVLGSGLGGAGFADNLADRLVGSCLVTLDPSLPSVFSGDFLFGIMTVFVQLKSKATGWNYWHRRWMLPPPQLLTRRSWRSPASGTSTSAAPSRGPLLAGLPAPPMRSPGSRPRGPIGCGNVLNSTRARPPPRARYALL